MPLARLRRIFSLAAPIVTAMLSGNVLNLVDTAMVGTLGDSALAGVGIGAFASYMCFALVMGVSNGVQTIAARRKGEGRHGDLAESLNSGIVYSLLVSLPLTVLLYFLTPRLFPYLNDDPEVVGQGVDYMRMMVLMTAFVGLKFAFRGYWNGVDMSRLYMATLIVMHASNILFNYVLIFGKLGLPALGVLGAGLGTLLAHAVGVGIYFFLGWKHARPSGFLSAWPTWTRLRELARLSLPTGMQQVAFAAGYTVLYKILGLLGTAEVAAAAVMVNVSLVAVLPAMGLGMSAMTLVSQALGRNDRADAARWAWDVVKVTAGLLLILGSPIVLAPSWVLSLFLHDPETLALASLPMRVLGATLPIEGAGLVLMHSLLGAGDVRRVLVVGVAIQWLLYLPSAYVLGPFLRLGLLAVWIAGISFRTLQMAIFVALWRGGRWAEIKV